MKPARVQLGARVFIEPGVTDMIEMSRHPTKRSEEEFYAPVPVSRAAIDPNTQAARLLAAFLTGRKEETIKASVSDE
jgi:hypothetical protein